MTTVVVSGANRGLGLEFARQYAEEGARVFAGAREPSQAKELNEAAESSGGRLILHALDVADAGSVAAFAGAVGQTPVDILIANAGIFGGDRQHRLGDIDYADMLRTFDVNALGALRLVDALAANVKAAKGKILAITSRMGSIGDASGGYYGYRASKAAMNMIFHALANDLRGDGVVCLPLSPGWARTDMGGPSAPQDSGDTVREMRKLIVALGPADTGRFLGWTGEEVPW